MNYLFHHCFVLFQNWCLEFFSPNSTFLSTLIHSPSSSSPVWLFFRSNFFSCFLAPSLFLTSIAFRNLSSNITVFLFSSGFASHLLSNWACHLISAFSSFLISFLLDFLYLRHFVYQCPTVYSVSPHYQYWVVFIFTILARYIFSTLCPTFSGWYYVTYFWGASPRTGLISSFFHMI